MPAPWPDLSLNGDPRLIVGNRKGSGLIDCYRVDIHEDTFEEFRDIADTAVSRIAELTRRPYAHFGSLEEDEYFALDNASIPNRPRPKRRRKAATDSATEEGAAPESSSQGPSPGSDEVAAALRIVAETDQHPVLSAEGLRRGLKLNLYMISYPTDAGFLGFIRRTGPQRSIAPGLRFFQYGDTLKRVTQPDFVFDDRVDIIVGPDEVAIFSDSAVQVLFRDVQLVMESVTENVHKVVSRFDQHLPLTPGGADALRTMCAKGPRIAKRLNDLVQHRLSDLTLEPETTATALSSHRLGHLLINKTLDLAEESIPSFLDFLEGRLYHDDHTQEPRRADRYSTRS